MFGKFWRVFCFQGWKLPQGLYNRSKISYSLRGSQLYPSDFLFPLQPPPPPSHKKKTGRPTPESLFSVHFGSVLVCFGSVWVRLGLCFGSVSGLFRVRFGVLGGVRVGSGRGTSAREKNITTLPMQDRFLRFADDTF